MTLFEVTYEVTTEIHVSIEADSKTAAMDAVRRGEGQDLDSNVLPGTRRKFRAVADG